jgi:hypothetical protein
MGRRMQAHSWLLEQKSPANLRGREPPQRLRTDEYM